jgi:hypothetical protein
MSVNLSPVGNAFQFFSNDGLPLNAGKIFTYQAGSTTPLATYTDSSGLIANTNPIILGTDGRPPSTIWLSDSFFYKFVLTDASDVVIQTYDNLYGIIGTIPTVAPASLPAGCILLWSGSIGSIPAGFVLCNGLNGTPDLRNRFVVGAGSTYAVDASGGSADAIVVSHAHTTVVGNPSVSLTGSFKFTDDSPGSPASVRAENISGIFSGTSTTGDFANLSGVTATGNSSVNIDATHIHAVTVNSTGSSGTNANLPPYYALCYIMKT